MKDIPNTKEVYPQDLWRLFRWIRECIHKLDKGYGFVKGSVSIYDRKDIYGCYEGYLLALEMAFIYDTEDIYRWGE
mgnify:CR=1 FL=1